MGLISRVSSRTYRGAIAAMLRIGFNQVRLQRALSTSFRLVQKPQAPLETKKWADIDAEKLHSSDPELKTVKGNPYTIPNLLSMSRIVAAPFLAGLAITGTTADFDMLAAGIAILVNFKLFGTEHCK